MKKALFGLALLILLAFSASAEAFQLDENAVIGGMKYSWYQGYQPVIQGSTLTLHLPIRGERAVGPIRVGLRLEDPRVFLLSTPVQEVTAWEQNGLYPATLYVQLQYGRRNGDYLAVITITGTDQNGRELKQELPYILRIRDGQESHETLQPEIQLENAQLQVGGEGSMTFTITNKCTTISMTAGVLTVTESSGDVLMRGTGEISLPELLPGKEETITVPLIVSGNAAVKEHSFTVKLQYEALGMPGFLEQKLTLPVEQEIRLEHGSVNLPSAIAGDVGSLTLPLMNMGKGELRNVLVKLEADGMGEQSVLVGTLPSGETRSAKVTFTPKEADVGNHKGTVTVMCEDAFGNQTQQSIPVELTVEEAPKLQEPDEVQQETRNPWVMILGIACGVLAAALIVEGALLMGKIHRLEEERL